MTPTDILLCEKFYISHYRKFELRKIKISLFASPFLENPRNKLEISSSDKEIDPHQFV